MKNELNINELEKILKEYCESFLIEYEAEEGTFMFGPSMEGVGYDDYNDCGAYD